jgi:metallophosphoesterase superfamily enzyme
MPYDDRRALKAVIQFISDTQPDELIHIGDLMDNPTSGRWSKGYAQEFAQQVKEDVEQVKRRFLEPVREVYAGPFGIHEGNHDLRPREYLAKYAPALAQFSESFHFEMLLDFDGFGVELLPEFYDVAPGWLSTHGHRGQISLSRIAGNTAMGAARKFGKSVVMGHTHRMGILSETRGYGGKVQSLLTGMEVGNLMNMKLAEYLKGGTGNWQQGFGVLTVDGKHVKPEVVPITGGHFSFDGHTWKV